MIHTLLYRYFRIRSDWTKFHLELAKLMDIVFKIKSQNKLANPFRFKDRISKELTSGVVYKFQWGLCNESYYGECVRHLNVRIRDHIGIHH